MEIKAYVNDNGMANIQCEKCNKIWNSNVKHFRDINKKIVVKCKCPCGHTQKVLLERREHYRKMTDLPGQYIHAVSRKGVTPGIMIVKDLSRHGLRLKINNQSNDLPDVSDIISVKFRLNDKHQSLIEKSVVIKNRSGNFIGSEFQRKEIFNKALGFYLLQRNAFA